MLRMIFCTIGYEGAEMDSFLSCLQLNEIKMLIDVRERPLSRKPGFSQKKLIEKTGDVGISYKHVRPLGCPSDIRDMYRETEDWPEYCRRYGSHLTSNLAALDELAAIVLKNFKSALMCFEADPARCHRSLIAHELVARYPKMSVVNLFPASPR